MRRPVRLAAVLACSALLAAPALAAPPAGTGGPPGSGQAQAGPGTGGNGKAYGRYCQGESKKHVKGEKGTAFSRCVTAMAHLASGKAGTPRAACAGLSRKHVKGEKGTAFSRCVAAGARLLHDLGEQSGSDG